MGALEDVGTTTIEAAGQIAARGAAPPADAAAPTADGVGAHETHESGTFTNRRKPQALVELIDRDGHVRQAWPVYAWPAHFGRALDNDVVLTDTHIAAHHFTLDMAEDGALALEVGDTINGVTVGLHRVGAGQRFPIDRRTPTTELVAGRTRLRVRFADTELAPEMSLAAIAVRHLRVLPSLAVGVLVLAGIAFNTYLDTDPDVFGRFIGNNLLVALGGAAVWCGAWALLSKTITRQSHFSWHLRVFMIAAFTLLALAAVPGLLAFSLSWPWLTDFSFIATYAVGAMALYFHLLALEPARPRLLRWMITTGVVVGVALTLWYNLQRTSRIGDELYMSHLFPPKLRVAKPLAIDRFISELSSLRPLLDKKAKEATNADEVGGPTGDARPDDDDE